MSHAYPLSHTHTDKTQMKLASKLGQRFNKIPTIILNLAVQHIFNSPQKTSTILGEIVPNLSS